MLSAHSSWRQLVWGGGPSAEQPPRTAGRLAWTPPLQTGSALPPPLHHPLPPRPPSPCPPSVPALSELPGLTSTQLKVQSATGESPRGRAAPSCRLRLHPRRRVAPRGGPGLGHGKRRREAKRSRGLREEPQQPRGWWCGFRLQVAVRRCSGAQGGPDPSPACSECLAPGQRSARVPWCACVASWGLCSASGSLPSCSSKACRRSGCACVWSGRWSWSNVCCSLHKGRCRVSLLEEEEEEEEERDKNNETKSQRDGRMNTILNYSKINTNKDRESRQEQVSLQVETKERQYQLRFRILPDRLMLLFISCCHCGQRWNVTKYKLYAYYYKFEVLVFYMSIPISSSQLSCLRSDTSWRQIFDLLDQNGSQ